MFEDNSRKSYEYYLNLLNKDSLKKKYSSALEIKDELINSYLKYLSSVIQNFFWVEVDSIITYFEEVIKEAEKITEFTNKIKSYEALNKASSNETIDSAMKGRLLLMYDKFCFIDDVSNFMLWFGKESLELILKNKNDEKLALLKLQEFNDGIYEFLNLYA